MDLVDGRAEEIFFKHARRPGKLPQSARAFGAAEVARSSRLK